MDSLLCAVVLLSLINYAHGQVLFPNCSAFSLAPMDLILAPNEMACLDCEYPSPFSAQWAVELEASFSVILGGSEPEDCDCTIDSTSRLCFNNIDSSAAHRYYCSIQEETSIDSFQCIFQIDVATPPVITSTNPDVIVNQGEQVTLSLSYQPGNPEGEVVWSKAGTGNIASGGRYSIDPSTRSLTINDIMANDRGLYTVTITNKAGSVTTSYNLFVNFVNIVSFGTTAGSSGMVNIGCEGIGWPNLDLSVSSAATGLFSGIAETDLVYETESRLTKLVPENCADVITCTVVAGILSFRETFSPCATSTPLITRVELVSTSSVTVTWSGSSTSFTIQYWVQGILSSLVMIPVSGGTTQRTISGLSAGQTYLVEVCTANGQCSNQSTFIVDTCESSFIEPVRGVTAVTVSNNNVRTIRLSWEESTEVGVTGYRIYVNPCPMGVPCTPTVLETTFDFPTAICGGTYQFLVQSINDCGGGGPNSSLVVRECDVQNQLTNIAAHGDGVTIQWDFVDTPISMSVTAQTVIPDDQNHDITLIFTVPPNTFMLESVCIEGLESDTMYDVCLMPVFVDGNAPGSFCDHATTTGAQTASGVGCISYDSMSTTDSGLTPTTESVIQNWHIAIIVVGGLAVVAMVFCLVGLCFACQTSKQKVDFGSSSSLSTTYNTNSVKDGISMQRSMSPARSCLSYHHKGHSTNWNDHVDTLRQMETEGGTNV